MRNTETVKIIVTLGPATSSEEDLRKIKDKGVHFVRINMSHSTIEDLQHYLKMAKKVGIPFVIDTEGSQVRTGNLDTPSISVTESGLFIITVYDSSYDELSLGIGSYADFAFGYGLPPLEPNILPAETVDPPPAEGFQHFFALVFYEGIPSTSTVARGVVTNVAAVPESPAAAFLCLLFASLVLQHFSSRGR